MFKNHIIKALIAACLINTGTTIFCWNNVIKNDTNGEILVKIQYAGGGICSPETRILQPNEEINVDSKICCAQTIFVRVSSGSLSGQTYSLETPRAGINMTCAHFRVRVYGTTGNVLIAEATLG